MANVIVLHAHAKAQDFSDFDTAWAAGFFEGEGAVSIAYNSSQCPSPCLSIRVSQVDKSPLVWLKSRWKGTIRFCNSPKHNGRNYYVWNLRSRQAARFLMAIRPFVVRDHVRKRIDVAIRFQSQKVHNGVASAAYNNNQLYYFNEMKKLNKRGTDADEETASEQTQELLPNPQFEFTW